MFFVLYYPPLMIQPPYTQEDIFAIQSTERFTELAMEAFRFQYKNNQIYHQFCDLMGGPDKVRSIEQIPFLPIELYKNHKIISGYHTEQIIFRSSGTTGAVKSEHYILDLSWYHGSLIRGFELVFGPAKEYCFLALLPGYVERQDSSLIYMVNTLMRLGLNDQTGFFKNPDAGFIQIIEHNRQKKIPTILFGVSFSLLSFAEKYPIDLSHVILIETGGMKGMAEEKTKEELHTILKEKFKLKNVYSEYGMTELLSQAYSTSHQTFETPAWMKVLIREPNDPVKYLPLEKSGGINVIDLANIYSCCFIATQDLGKKNHPNTFEVLGRFDHSDLRGCNLLFS